MVEWTPEKIADAQMQTFHLRLAPDDYKALKHEAVERECLVSDIIRGLITAHLERNRG